MHSVCQAGDEMELFWKNAKRLKTTSKRAEVHPRPGISSRRAVACAARNSPPAVNNCSALPACLPAYHRRSSTMWRSPVVIL